MWATWTCWLPAAGSHWEPLTGHLHRGVGHVEAGGLAHKRREAAAARHVNHGDVGDGVDVEFPAGSVDNDCVSSML